MHDDEAISLNWHPKWIMEIASSIYGKLVSTTPAPRDDGFKHSSGTKTNSSDAVNDSLTYLNTSNQTPPLYTGNQILQYTSEGVQPFALFTPTHRFQQGTKGNRRKL
ncbi:hypothetical protein [Gracilimonas sediminicola]|uniref:hypothetical protein n=1 Tax=Gracilimonas sediminicola TaxID=2952158 RepID=UPI0038D42E95